MATYYGWAGTMLDVDLSRGKIERQSLPRDWAEKDVGGLAFGSRILFDQVGPEVDPLSPDNVMVILTGALNGTGAPSCGRCDLVTRSPLTGIFLRSNLGGFFGPELKWAGYDLITVRGRSEKPVWLWI